MTFGSKQLDRAYDEWVTREQETEEEQEGEEE